METGAGQGESRLRLIDSHAHLNIDAFDADRDQVLERAAQAGVVAVVLPSIDMAGAGEILKAAIRSATAFAHVETGAPPYTLPHAPHLFGAIGIHPSSSANSFGSAADADESVFYLRVMADNAAIVAVGEIGLDNYWKDVEPALQEEAFRRQLALAAELGKPVIIHSREANAQVVAILREWVAGSHFRSSPLAQRPFAGVLHAFSGDAALAEEAYGLGFVLGLGGPVTFKKATELHALLPQLDLNRLLLETDAPYLTPHPFRGKRNEPAHLPLICATVAQHMGRTPSEVAEATTAVAVRLFGLENRLGSEIAPRVANP